jgi:hypothetical protein
MGMLSDHPDLISKLRVSIDSLEWNPVATGNRREWRIGLPRKLDMAEMVMVVMHLGLEQGQFSFRESDSGSPELHIYSEPLPCSEPSPTT